MEFIWHFNRSIWRLIRKIRTAVMIHTPLSCCSWYYLSTIQSHYTRFGAAIEREEYMQKIEWHNGISWYVSNIVANAIRFSECARVQMCRQCANARFIRDTPTRVMNTHYISRTWKWWNIWYKNGSYLNLPLLFLLAKPSWFLAEATMSKANIHMHRNDGTVKGSKERSHFIPVYLREWLQLIYIKRNKFEDISAASTTKVAISSEEMCSWGHFASYVALQPSN